MRDILKFLGSMAQLVARFVRNEEVGGSNPPRSTKCETVHRRVGRFWPFGLLAFGLFAALLRDRWLTQEIFAGVGAGIRYGN